MAHDWTKIYKQYRGLWVGLKEDQITVVASGKTVQEVMRKALNEGFKQPILFKVPTKIFPYVGCG